MDTSCREMKELGRVPYFVRRQFPKDHPVYQDNHSSDGGSSSDLDLDEVIPSGVVEVHYIAVDGKPGLSVSTCKMHGLL